jgi:hypothetical protein
MSSRLVVALIWFTSGRRLAAMHTARRVLRIAPADMTPRMTEEGTHVGIDRGQFADLTRIRDEEPGFPAFGYSALSTPGSAPIKGGGNIATHRFQSLLDAAFILLISRHFRGATLTRRSKNCALQ